MGISQSDFSSHLNLLISAELYRRYLIKELNNKMAYGGSKTGDWDWKVDANYWGTIKDFTYPNAKLSQSVKSINVELAAILFWILLVTVSTTITSKKLTVL
jgi:ABC-2 type transport system permease protein